MNVLLKRAMPLALMTLLTACGGSPGKSTSTMTPEPETPAVTPMQYRVTVSNLTAGQPFSPVAVMLQESGELWQIGQPASDALEMLAEGGDSSGIVASDFVVDSMAADSPLLPGMQSEIDISTMDTAATKLSLVTMLVNTNDGFSGLNAVDLSGLAVGDSMTLRAPVYDAGTEANSEQAGTIPGPADGGEGYNAARDDVGFVAMHPGVVSHDDGLSDSVLGQEQRFDNPAMMVTIERMQ